MITTPFLAGFGEKTKAVEVRGRYNKNTQTFVTEKFDRTSGRILASMPTHIETDTGGHNDTDTGTTED